MHEQTLNQAAIFVRSHVVKGAEGQDDEIHYKVDGDAEEHAADEPVGSKKGKSAARQAIDGRGAERDGEVQQDAQNPGEGAATYSTRTEQAGRDGERDFPAKREEG